MCLCKGVYHKIQYCFLNVNTLKKNIGPQYLAASLCFTVAVLSVNDASQNPNFCFMQIGQCQVGNFGPTELISNIRKRNKGHDLPI